MDSAKKKKGNRAKDLAGGSKNSPVGIAKSRISSCFSKAPAPGSCSSSRASEGIGIVGAGGGGGVVDDLPPGFKEVARTDLCVESETKVAPQGLNRRLTDQEKEEFRKQHRCYTCGEEGHPYFRCPYGDKRLHAIQAEKNSNSSYKLWRDPYWSYRNEVGELQGPYSLSTLASKLHNGTLSGWCEVMHEHVHVAGFALGNILELADLKGLGDFIQVKVALRDLTPPDSTVLSHVQTNLYLDVVDDIVDDLIDACRISKKQDKLPKQDSGLHPAADAARASPSSPDLELAAVDSAVKPTPEEDLKSTGTELQKSTPEEDRKSTRSEILTLEHIQQRLHSTVVEAAKRTILDAAVGQFLNSWISEQESRKKALIEQEALRQRENALNEYVEKALDDLPQSDAPKAVKEVGKMREKPDKHEDGKVQKKRASSSLAERETAAEKPAPRKRQKRQKKLEIDTSDEEEEKPKKRPKSRRTRASSEAAAAAKAEKKAAKSGRKEQNGRRRKKSKEASVAEDLAPEIEQTPEDQPLPPQKQDQDQNAEVPKTIQEQEQEQESSPMEEEQVVQEKQQEEVPESRKKSKKTHTSERTEGKIPGKRSKKRKRPEVVAQIVEEKEIIGKEEEVLQQEQTEVPALIPETLPSTAATIEPDEENRREVRGEAAGLEFDDETFEIKVREAAQLMEKYKDLDVVKVGEDVTAEEEEAAPASPGRCARCYGWERREMPAKTRRQTKIVAVEQTHKAAGSRAGRRGKFPSARSTRAENRSLGTNFKARAKRLKFQRSKIHSWGVIALQAIEPEDFVIEYVGELVRSKVADLRERRYEKMGIDSSYLFKIDQDNVVDATKHGGLARFINHSCDPNCYTKIIHKRIFIYSKRHIEPGEELTYKYNFPIEETKIPCHCGSERCQRYLT